MVEAKVEVEVGDGGPAKRVTSATCADWSRME